jgi:uncharacterized protein YidB (DUF937 family)
MDTLKGMIGKSGGTDAMGQLASMLTGKGGDGMGLSRLLEQFKSAGLGDKAASWVGTGPNESLSADEVEKAIGPERLDAMSKKTGQSVESLKGDLSDLIPKAVNKLTPDGKVPKPSELLGMVKGMDFGKLLGR